LTRRRRAARADEEWESQPSLAAESLQTLSDTVLTELSLWLTEYRGWQLSLGPWTDTMHWDTTLS